MATNTNTKLDLSKADKELAAEKAWQLDGSDPTKRPATPTLDEMTAKRSAA